MVIKNERIPGSSFKCSVQQRFDNESKWWQKRFSNPIIWGCNL